MNENQKNTEIEEEVLENEAYEATEENVEEKKLPKAIHKMASAIARNKKKILIAGLTLAAGVIGYGCGSKHENNDDPVDVNYTELPDDTDVSETTDTSEELDN